MRHPNSRSERRHNGEIWRNRQRFVMMNIWFRRKNDPEYWHDNNMWWARKQSSAHGNRCSCHYEKFSKKEIRKRRVALDRSVIENVQSFQEEEEVGTAHRATRYIRVVEEEAFMARGSVLVNISLL